VHTRFFSFFSRIQQQSTFLYRKSASLAPATRWALIQVLCQSVKILSSILGDEQDNDGNKNSNEMSDGSQAHATQSSARHTVVSNEFRDAFACHLYMLFSVMFFMESEAKIGNGMTKSRGGGNKTSGGDSLTDGEDTVQMRSACAEAMLAAARSMSQNRFKLWKRGVADEAVVALPCRIAYQMLESASGVLARKAASADLAMATIAATVDSCDSLMSTVLTALMDMMHSYEHMASLCAELCTMVSTNRLGMELIREVGRLDTRGCTDSGKSSGIKFVAPFVWELALCRPQLVLANISHLLPHLDMEPYYLRSAILTALGYIVEYIGKALKPSDEDNPAENVESESSPANMEKSRAALLDILQQRAHDISSYTRSAVLKAWIRLAQAGSIPVDRVLSVTIMAIDRLQDKTVMVRKQSLQVCISF
jgi:condensin complex subunit 1